MLRDTKGIIADCVGVAGSLEEAIQLVDEEMAKGDCSPILKYFRDKRIRSLWAQKIAAQKFPINA